MHATALNQNVLVLNRNWLVIHVTNLRRAFGLVFQGFAKIVGDDMRTYDFDSWRAFSEVAGDGSEFSNGEDSAYIATPNYKLLVPEVIQLSSYGRVPPRRVKFSRRNIFLRDNFTCQYCGCRPPQSELTIDHVLPKSKGGRSTWENVVLSCVKCNSRKGSLSVAEAGLKLAKKPKRPHWLACALQAASAQNRPLWTKFLDEAYWNVQLKED